MSKRVVRIGSASAALSDSALAVPQLLAGGKLDYLVGDYLAEGSMGLLAMFASAQARVSPKWRRETLPSRWMSSESVCFNMDSGRSWKQC